jgi:arginase
MRTIRIFGAPVEEGAGRTGCRMGPGALRDAGLADALEAAGHVVIDDDDLRIPASPPAGHPNPAIKHLAEVSAWIEAIAAALDGLATDSVPIVIGGDHSIAAGSIPALNRRAQAQGRKLFVLWLDAHADFHGLDSTSSGNLHGVPLAYVVGRPGFDGFFPALSHPLPADRVCLMGLRSVDAAERIALADGGAIVHEMGELHDIGALPLLRRFLDRVAREEGVLHVSFDVDFLDPAVAPGVGTTVEGGPALADVFAMMRMLSESGLVGSLDVAELNPALDRSARTARLLVDLIAGLLAHPFSHPYDRSVQSCLQD